MGRGALAGHSLWHSEVVVHSADRPSRSRCHGISGTGEVRSCLSKRRAYRPGHSRSKGEEKHFGLQFHAGNSRSARILSKAHPDSLGHGRTRSRNCLCQRVDAPRRPQFHSRPRIFGAHGSWRWPRPSFAADADGELPPSRRWRGLRLDVCDFRQSGTRRLVRHGNSVRA